MSVRVIPAVAAIVAGVSLVATPAPRAAQSDLDEFMKAVLARRDENWKKLKQYVLDERELVQVRGPGRLPIWGESREYSWYIRDGYFIRSPTRANGVAVPEADRVRYEEAYFARVKQREERRQKLAAEAGTEAPAAASPAEQPPADADAVLAELRKPRFIDTAYFLEFKFEEGKYAFVGREQFEGRDVYRIEYYPARLFDDENDRKRRREEAGAPRRDQDRGAALERMMNKVSLVTLWVEPRSHQIVKYTFTNVNLDFLPAAWLLRVTDLQAEMTMSQPFPDVWLPRDIELYAGILVAIGTFDARYRIEYFDYREAVTSGRIKRAPDRP